MFFSIIVPVYNAQDFISLAVESVLSQSFKDYELILINDGSKDMTPRILDDYADKDMRVKVLHIKNGGVSHARNEGIKLAKGKYLLFLDSDDRYKPDALNILYQVCEKENPDFLTYAYEECIVEKEQKKRLIHSGKAYKYTNSDAIKKDLLNIVSSEMFGAVWSKVYKNEIIKNNNIKMNENLYLGEDYCFNLEMLKCVNKYQIIEAPLYIYMIQNSESLIKRYKNDKFEQMYLMHKIRSEYIMSESNCDVLNVKMNCRMNFIRLCISSFMDLSREECPYQLREKINFIKAKINVENEKFNISYISRLSMGQIIIYIIFQSKQPLLIFLFSKICYFLKFKMSRSTQKVNQIK